MLQILIDNAGSILLAVCFVVTSFIGKPKTAEKIKAKMEKKQAKLIAKGSKIASQLESIDEVKKNGNANT